MGVAEPGTDAFGKGDQGFILRVDVQPEVARLAGTEVGVPVPDRVAGVKDRGHAGVLAGGPSLGILRLTGGAGEDLGNDDGGVRVRGRGDGTDPTRSRVEQFRLTAMLRQPPQRGLLSGIVGAVARAGPGRGEQQVARREESGTGFTLGAAGQPVRGPLPRGVHFPKGGGVARALRIEGGHRRHEAASAGVHREPAHPREGDEVLELVERRGLVR